MLRAWGMYGLGFRKRSSGRADSLTGRVGCTPILRITAGACKGSALALPSRFPLSGWPSRGGLTTLVIQIGQLQHTRVINPSYRGARGYRGIPERAIAT